MANDSVENLGHIQPAADAHPSVMNAKNMAPLTNKSGGTVVSGDVLVQDVATATAFTTNTTLAALRKVYVVPKTVSGSDTPAQKSILNNEIGFVQASGFCQGDAASIAGGVLVDGVVAIGEYLQLSATAKKATGTGITMSDTAVPPIGSFGVALATTAGEDIVAAFLYSETVMQPKHNHTATGAPGVTNDVDEGYSVNSLWTNVSADLTYICQDATDGAAVWQLLAAGGGLLELDDQTLSAVATYDKASIPATGGDLIIRGELSPVTDNVAVYLRLNNYSGASDYAWAYSLNDGGAISTQRDVADNQIAIGRSVGNAANAAARFTVTIPNYADPQGDNFALVNFMGAQIDLGSNILVTNGGGALLKSEAITRVTLLFATGNIADGRVRLYLAGD